MKSLLFILGFLGFMTSAQASSTEQRIVEIKQQIIQLAAQHTSNESTQAQIRAELNPLVIELESLAGLVSKEQILQHSPGSWRQLWSDEKDMSPPGSPKRDLAQVYQYIDAGGWGYNFGVRVLPNGQKVTFALAAVASVEGNKQTTEITKAFSRNTGLIIGEGIADLSKGIHYATGSDFVERNAGRFPRGPIGAKGELTIHYLDGDVKIGTTPNVYDGRVEMFVMLREELVVE